VPRRALALALALLLALLLAGCGATAGEDRPNEEATLLLDFAPNGVHAGLYVATDRGYDDAEGVALTVRQPASATDALRLLTAGRAEMAILDIHDLGLARERGRDVVGVMALVQRPLAAVFAQPGVRTPRALEDRRLGVSGLPSDEAVMRAVIAGAGGDAERLRLTTIGFEAVPALLANRVAAATAFWNVEGVALKARKPGIREFRVDDYGAPPYPELVLAVTRETLEDDRAVVVATIRALQRGYREARIDPESAVSAMLAADPSLDREALLAQLDAVQAAFTSGARAFGELRPAVLREWAAWDEEFGILREAPDVERAFDATLVPLR